MRQSKRKFLTQKPVRRPKLRNVIRWGLYAVCIFLAFVTANGGDFTKPLLLIPIALCISSVSGAVVSGGIGILCGLLLDISCGTLAGYHGILLFLICLAVSCMYDRLLLQRFWNLIWLTAVAAFGDRFRLRLSVCDLGLSPGFPAVSAPHAPLSGVYRHQQHDLLSSLFSDSPFPAAKAAAYH